jgi:hypothetical protein
MSYSINTSSALEEICKDTRSQVYTFLEDRDLLSLRKTSRFFRDADSSSKCNN